MNHPPPYLGGRFLGFRGWRGCLRLFLFFWGFFPVIKVLSHFSPLLCPKQVLCSGTRENPLNRRKITNRWHLRQLWKWLPALQELSVSDRKDVHKSQRKWPNRRTNTHKCHGSAEEQFIQGVGECPESRHVKSQQWRAGKASPSQSSASHPLQSWHRENTSTLTGHEGTLGEPWSSLRTTHPVTYSYPTSDTVH